MTIKPDNGNIITRAKTLLSTRPTMTLATAANEIPWAAPVYYVARNSGLYFFSSPDARHITQALSAGRAACAVYAEDSAWENLMGLQMSGRIAAISGGLEASKAIFAYIAKFPAVNRFFSGIKDIDLKDFLCKFHAKLYYFIPDTIFFMDNTVQFGFRNEINRDDLFK